MPDRRTEHGWVTEDGFLCFGCAVNWPHEHRCDGPPCQCKSCNPTPEELAGFVARLSAGL